MVIDPKQKQAIQQEFIQALTDAGLVIMPYSVGMYASNFYKEQQKLLRQKSVTAYQIAKWQLLPGVKSIKTVKNMVKDGRIAAGESYVNTHGVQCILTTAIKRLQDV